RDSPRIMRAVSDAAAGSAACADRGAVVDADENAAAPRSAQSTVATSRIARACRVRRMEKG
ncbi:MAG: hypothetical protein JWO31_1598, partial [Phycisphaerales bacterium]|nr:hypothetical protein [Phycisphaerales bacterium]